MLNFKNILLDIFEKNKKTNTKGKPILFNKVPPFTSASFSSSVNGCKSRIIDRFNVRYQQSETISNFCDAIMEKICGRFA